MKNKYSKKDSSSSFAQREPKGSQDIKFEDLPDIKSDDGSKGCFDGYPYRTPSSFQDKRSCNITFYILVFVLIIIFLFKFLFNGM